MRFASVYVENAVIGMDKAYDYRISDELAEKVLPGVTVTVPFGKGNKKRFGIVAAISDKTDVARTKPVLSVDESRVRYSENEMSLILWMKNRYFTTFYETASATFGAVKGITATAVYTINSLEQDVSQLDLPLLEVLRIFEENGGTMTEAELSEKLTPQQSEALSELVFSGYIQCESKSEKAGLDLTVKTVRLAMEQGEIEACLGERKLTKNQEKLIEVLAVKGAMTVREIEYYCGVKLSTVKTLEKKGIVQIFDEEAYRNPYKNIQRNELKPLSPMTEHQKAVYDEMEKQFLQRRPSAALLYGVTSSGKTRVYLELVAKALEQGKSAIVLFPEIALTTQMLSLFFDAFGSRVAVLNSRLSVGERYDECKRIRKGLADVVIGTRSAVFAPVKDLGVIIIDEEQEHTYKSEQNPRYHARDVARFRCANEKALLVLASATPSIESYYNAVSGRYTLYKLGKRFGGNPLPKVVIADIKQQMLDGGSQIIGTTLKRELAATLEKGEQAVIFINRRGYNTFVSCRECGHVQTCPNCSIALTYHEANDRLMCHCCGYSTENISKCTECGSEYVKYSGVGTQRAEAEILKLFPMARILRMDADTTGGKESHEKILSAFKQGKADILIGTQMVTKGLDFPKVTLVGVLSADGMLYSDSFMAFEQAFSMLTQVVGRAGRGESEGRAVIQTTMPESEVIKAAVKQDYEGFFATEINMRRQMHYPPFCDICLAVLSSEKEESASKAAQAFCQLLQQTAKKHKVPIHILGPSKAAVYKANNKFRYKLFVRCRADKSFREVMELVMKAHYSEKANKDVSLSVDINPYVNI
ncbi:MAG: primosomal protein N' [Ruminococcaceae bacterium]|nr:primosomal protein N' [Oscillospiraceae bacterium]